MKILSNRTESLFGNMPYIFQKKVMKWERRKNIENSKFLIVDDKDGHLCLCPLRKNIPVVVFEPNKTFIEGGKMEIPIGIPNTNEYTFVDRTIMGIKDRIINEQLKTNCKIINRNYYEVDHYEQYMYVTACRSLDRESNQKYSMEYKINKLKNNVANNGYLYFEYKLALEDDPVKYPKNIYLRKDEIKQYFPKEEWTIISSDIKIVKDKLTPLNKKEKDIAVGYLDVKRTPTARSTKRNRVRTQYQSFSDDSRINVNHKYIINGVVR